jgi:hypothetical protein
MIISEVCLYNPKTRPHEMVVKFKDTNTNISNALARSIDRKDPWNVSRKGDGFILFSQIGINSRDGGGGYDYPTWNVVDRSDLNIELRFIGELWDRGIVMDILDESDLSGNSHYDSNMRIAWNALIIKGFRPIEFKK